MASENITLANLDPRLIVPPILRNLVGPNQVEGVRFQVELGHSNRDQEFYPDLAALIVKRRSGYIEETDPSKKLLLEEHRRLALEQGQITEDDQVLVSITAREPAPGIAAVLNFTEATDSQKYHNIERRFFPNFFRLLRSSGYKLALGTMMTVPLDQIRFSHLPNYQTVMACTKFFGLDPMKLEFLDMDLEIDCVKSPFFELPHS